MTDGISYFSDRRYRSLDIYILEEFFGAKKSRKEKDINVEEVAEHEKEKRKQREHG